MKLYKPKRSTDFRNFSSKNIILTSFVKSVIFLSVEISRFFCLSDFMWNQFQEIYLEEKKLKCNPTRKKKKMMILMSMSQMSLLCNYIESSLWISALCGLAISHIRELLSQKSLRVY